MCDGLKSNDVDRQINEENFKFIEKIAMAADCLTRTKCNLRDYQLW